MYLEPKRRDASPSQGDLARAMKILQSWAKDATHEDLNALSAAISEGLPAIRGNAYPEFSRIYPHDFVPNPPYMSTLPDLQNGPTSTIRGASEPIQHVGIANFRAPLRYRDGTDNVHVLETSVTGSVSLDAGSKGINMSRIMRTFYRHAEEVFDFATLDRVLADYRADLGSTAARILVRTSMPAAMPSLRSSLSGWQYYDVAMEAIAAGADCRHIVHVDYVYSSTCPCSLELSEHARRTRNQLATPHSQRSVARVSAEILGDGSGPYFKELIDLCRAAVPTETQVMVKREDEQAFAELNAANPIFVEDAARLFWERLRSDPGIGDFRVVASHQESLHSHDAVAVMTEGSLFPATPLEPRLFESMRH